MRNQHSQDLMVDLSGWTKVPNLRNIFVTSEGEVRSSYGSLTPFLDAKGYYFINYYPVYRNKKAYHKFVHQMIAEAFIGPRPGNLVVNHKDGNSKNNHVSNLEYCTQKQNVIQALKGKENKTSQKATKEQAIRMFHMDAEGYTSVEISAEFGLRPASVRGILTGNDSRVGCEGLVSQRKLTRRRFQRGVS